MSFIEPEGITKACATKKITSKTMITVPVQLFEKSKNLLNAFFKIYAFFARFLADFMVFDSSIAIVIGPTPPGTGVINEHFGATSSNLTSPFSLPPSAYFWDKWA